MSRNRRKRKQQNAPEKPVVTPPARGGRFQPLNERERDQIIDKAFAILAQIGMAGAPDWLKQCLLEQGAAQRHDGRLIFPRQRVEVVLNRACKQVTLPGFTDHRGLDIGGGAVHIGTGGAAIQMLEADGHNFRDAGLRDLYEMMWVLNDCPNIHYGVRPLVPKDVETPLQLDINTAYACVKATDKPIGVSFDQAEHVAAVVSLFDRALAGDRLVAEDAFRKQPFCMGIIVHVVPPLRFAAEGVDIMRACIAAGMPLQICSAGQAGATSPASLAGALAQGLAESLAGMMVVDALKPGHPCIYAFMPFISDLRTGSMTGGSGEAAIANAAAAQLLLHLGLPSTVSAGMTDAKVADAQAGYEKGYTVALAAQAGADMINLSVGMLGSIMVASKEALLIDDDMCAAIMRSVRGIEVNDELLDLNIIEQVVTGEGHYLGAAQTLKLMKSEYTYPGLGDRLSVAAWQEAGSLTVWDRAKTGVAGILQATPPEHLTKTADRRIREHFDILLKR